MSASRLFDDRPRIVNFFPPTGLELTASLSRLDHLSKNLPLWRDPVNRTAGWFVSEISGFRMPGTWQLDCCQGCYN
jgi:hypothetical protein